MLITCNTRILQSHLTGAQRYTLELLTHFGNRLHTVKPDKPLKGISGHAWEQFILPTKLNGGMLWSPCNVGPLVVENQVVSLLDVVPLDHPEWLNPKFASWYRFLTPRLAKRVRSIITISEFSKQRIIAHCPGVASKVYVTHLGVDSRFKIIEHNKICEMRNRLSIPSPHYIVVLGSLEPRKNLDRLLKAWSVIEERLPDDVYLVIAGAQGSNLVFGNVSFEKIPSRVCFTGHVPDDLLPALYSGAVASAYVSLYEGFGLPPLESMACGTPPLTGNLASLPEVVGDAGLMVDPYDVDAIADGLLRLIENSTLRSELSQKGLARVKNFTWENTADMTLRILGNAASQY